MVPMITSPHDKVRIALQQIEEVLFDKEAGPMLWSILTALRGPDMPSSMYLKRRSTVFVRAAAFPEIARLPHNRHEIMATMKPNDGDTVVTSDDLLTRYLGPYQSNHFNMHYLNAMQVLRTLGLTKENVHASADSNRDVAP